MEKTTYKSGSPYKIADLFSGNNDKINIPDLQRDYCWSAVTGLVDKFFDNLVELFRKYNPEILPSGITYCDVPLGLIYGYFDDYAENHLQLCDGQQRLTTLFILIGELNRRLSGNDCERWLMSDFEKNEDDHEPYLRYDIRESSLNFLTELTYGYFIKNGEAPIRPDNIRSQPWFINEYNQDPTAENIINAIYIISDKLNNCQMTDQEMAGFADFVVNLSFIFVDMESRQKGEETFVIINTTGESLTSAQNLKPLVINEVSVIESAERHEAARKWEEMETWFWQNRLEQEETNDDGINAFLYLLSIYKASNRDIAFKRMTNTKVEFPYKEISFDEIYSVFNAYKRIYGLLDRSKSLSSYPFTAKEVYKALPSLAYLERFPNSSDKEIKREFHVFSNITRYRDVDNDSRYKSVPAYDSASTVRDFQATPDVLSLIEVWSEKLTEKKDTYIDEEYLKLDFISGFKGSDEIVSGKPLREHVEELVYSMEDMKLFNGRISRVMEWAEGDWRKFEHILEKIKIVFDYGEPRIDCFRRAMLAKGVKPSADTLWYEWEELRGLIDSIPNLALDCIKDVDNSNVSKSLLSATIGYNDISNPLYSIIKYDNLLDKSDSKRFRRIGNSAAFLLKKEKTSAKYWVLLGSKFIPGRPDDFYSRIWNWESGLFMDANDFNIRIHCDLADYTLGVNWTILNDRKPISEEVRATISNYIIDKKFSREELLLGFQDYWQFVKDVLVSAQNNII